MYLSGQGVPADALAATLWLQRAAHAGAPDAERFASQASARMNDFQRARYQRELQQNLQHPPSAPPAPTRA
jgi:TPR repeat protein